MSTNLSNQPVFPLNIPLFPRCKLQLQIFEQRYLNMISRCLSNSSTFTVALLREGNERQEVFTPHVNQPNTNPIFYNIGTAAKIVDFDQKANGLLLVTIEGGAKRRLFNIDQQNDGLWSADTEDLGEDGSCQGPVPAHWHQILQTLSQSGPLPWIEQDNVQESPMLALNYLSMYLPVRPIIKQSLLEINQLNERWLQLNQLLEES